MPLYDYGCKDKDCENIWEVSHKISELGPSKCPKCGCEEVGKLLSAVKGSVELTGSDLRTKIKEDTAKLKREAAKSENVAANLVGESKYNDTQILRDKLKKEKY